MMRIDNCIRIILDYMLDFKYVGDVVSVSQKFEIGLDIGNIIIERIYRQLRLECTQNGVNTSFVLLGHQISIILQRHMTL